MGRLFWFAVGAGAAVYVASRARRSLTSASPGALTRRVSGSAGSLTASVTEFVERARAASAEREAELRATLGLHRPD